MPPTSPRRDNHITNRQACSTHALNLLFVAVCIWVVLWLFRALGNTSPFVIALLSDGQSLVLLLVVKPLITRSNRYLWRWVRPQFAWALGMTLMFALYSLALPSVYIEASKTLAIAAPVALGCAIIAGYRHNMVAVGAGIYALTQSGAYASLFPEYYPSRIVEAQEHVRVIAQLDSITWSSGFGLSMFKIILLTFVSYVILHAPTGIPGTKIKWSEELQVARRRVLLCGYAAGFVLLGAWTYSANLSDGDVPFSYPDIIKHIFGGLIAAFSTLKLFLWGKALWLAP